MIELSKIETTKENYYMEKARDEMIKMSRDERERYLYLREQMAISDKVSQLRSAENRGRKDGIQKGELLKLITLVQKKREKGESVDKIAEDLLEDIDMVKKIYNVLKEHPEKNRDEIYDFLME